jgi:alpha-L-fucosidase 2
MPSHCLIPIAVLFLLATVARTTAAEPIRVACVGDSITYGHAIAKRDQDSYPAQLQTLLGDGYRVGNFGVSGATLLSAGDLPWIGTGDCAAAEAFVPQVVVVMLGTNDTKPQNWARKAAFAGDLKALVARFAALPSHPTVLLCLPCPIFHDNFGITAAVLEEELLPLLRQAATDLGVAVVDVHGALAGRAECFLPDGIHPVETGMAIIASTVRPAVSGLRR